MEASRPAPPRLTVELVPKSCWFSNVRSVLDTPGWDQVRRRVYRQCGYVCEICGGRGPKHPVEAHEIWTYDDATKTQILSGMIGLCPDCHEVKHLGLAASRGREEAALNHLMRVNGWTAQQTIDYADQAFQVWAERSRHAWALDLRGLRPYVTAAAYRAACEAADAERADDLEHEMPGSGGVVVIDLGPPADRDQLPPPAFAVAAPIGTTRTAAPRDDAGGYVMLWALGAVVVLALTIVVGWWVPFVAVALVAVGGGLAALNVFD